LWNPFEIQGLRLEGSDVPAGTEARRMSGFGPYESDRTIGRSATGVDQEPMKREARQGWILVVLLGIATATVALSTSVATAGARDLSFLRFF
jgi:hypothetical protein